MIQIYKKLFLEKMEVYIKSFQMKKEILEDRL